MIRLGVEREWFGDLYHHLLTIGWLHFFALGSLTYVAANIVFAGLYLLQPGSILQAHPGSGTDAFFFSVQTMATIGYGVMSPATFYANVLMTIETAVGLMFVALTTGLVFARFSRPTARVLFSNVAVVGPFDGIPTLSIRMANQRRNQMLAAEVSMTLVRDEVSEEGDPELVAAGAKVRQEILWFIQRRLPAGSADAYSRAELDALNAHRKSHARFEPY